ncbi:MAG: polysaccharide deacetylase family protein [Kiloniellaceae bacterium]
MPQLFAASIHRRAAAWARRVPVVGAPIAGALIVGGLLAGLLGPAPGTQALAAAADQSGAAIIMYHRFGESEYPSTSITLEQFEAHIAELVSGGYTVLPVPEIVAAIAAGRALPDRTVGITVDDAYRSVYTEAWPRLRAAGLPFTVFVGTDALDQARPAYMSWDNLREMKATGGVTVGNHGATHAHMVHLDPAAARAEIDRAAQRFVAELGAAPTLFAYPYGEYSLALRAVVAEAGFAAAFGQYSGAMGPTGDRFALPRYPLSERYGDLDRLRLVANSLPLPVSEVTPLDPLVRGAANPPAYGFTVAAGLDRLNALNCFASGNETRVERLGAGRIEVRFARPFAPGRRRVNCTMPGPNGRWRWLGRQFYIAP